MERKLKEILARVFNLESAESIRDSDSLIADLRADSLDFVEMLHLVERNFGVVLKADEIMTGGGGLSPDDLFVEGKLTPQGVELLRARFGARGDSLREGMGKVALFSLLTVGDLTAIIQAKIAAGEGHV